MRKFIISDRIAKKLRGLDNVPRETEPSGKPEEEAAAQAAPPPPKSLRVIARTDIGLVRRINEDAVILGEGLMGVADGMGGHLGGETASAGTREGLLEKLAGKEPDGDTLRDAVSEVNRELWDRQLEDESLSGMGTTLTLLWVGKEEMLIAQVGDSRAYLLRDDRMKQMTEDHSIVADMVRRGLLSEEQASIHPMRNYITRAVGTEPDIETDILRIPRKAGDRWLLCSDGLHGPVPRERLQELMGMEDPEEAADQMIREALDQGGRDNISLVLILDEIGPEAGEVAE